MTTKSQSSETVTAVVAGLTTLWKSYKRTAARRHQDPFTSLFSEIFGTEMNDVDAARYLARDVADIRNTLRVKKTDREFDRIINRNYR